MSAELLSQAPVLANGVSIGDQPQTTSSVTQQQQLKEKQHALDGYPTMSMSPPSTLSSDPSESLSPLRDNRSSFKAVSKTCLLLNQFAANGSSKATTPPSTHEDGMYASWCDSVDQYFDSSSLFHEASFAQILSDSFAALLECIREHHDRRCRIIACKTVALVARAAYSRLRKSPHTLTGIRDDSIHNASGGGGVSSSHNNTAGNNYLNRLNDEVGTDIPMALCVVALEDVDDGVAATAMSSLGTMVISTIPGSLHEDELWTEVRAMTQVGLPPYASSLRNLLEENEDGATHQSELQIRILDNAICPRLLQLLSRCMAFEHVSHLEMVLPIVTTALVYASKTTIPNKGSNNTKTNQRLEEDKNLSSPVRMRKTVAGDHNESGALIEMVVDRILLPLMQNSRGGATLVAALSSVRFIHVSPLAPWVRELSHWALIVLKEECENQMSTCLETQLPILATLVVLSRIIPLPERSKGILTFVVERLVALPSTGVAPLGVVSAGILLQFDKHNNGGGTLNMNHYRRPIRPAFWAELALSFFLDGPLQITTPAGAVGARSTALVGFLKSSQIQDIFEGKSGNGDHSIGTHSHIREELVTSFCMVAIDVGKRHQPVSENSRTGGLTTMTRRDELEEWIRLSLALLEAFRPCLGWGEAPSYVDEDITMLVASQVAYSRLLQEVLHSAGLLNRNSLTLKMTASATPSHLLWDQFEDASEHLLRFDPMPVISAVAGPLGRLVDDIVKTEIKGAGIVSHHMRILLMSLAVDHWIQARHIASRKPTSSSEIGMNVESAKQLLVTISPRRMFGKLVESNKNQVENYSSKKKEKFKKYAQDAVRVHVACIETMALVACNYKNKFGKSTDTKAVLNYSIKSLQGKSGNELDAPILSLCQAAIERIQAAFETSSKHLANSVELSSLVPDMFKRRSRITTSRITQGSDAFNEGYMTQLSRQIISSRADRCIFAFPPVPNLSCTVYKQNWLRLGFLPLPKSRNPQVSIQNIPKYKWGSNVSVCTPGSDPVAVTLSHFLRRNMRYDGEDEFRVMITMRVDNLTAVEAPNGLRLELGITEENASISLNAQDRISLEVSKSLTEGYDSSEMENMFGSSAVTYKNGLKGGDYVTWHLILNHLPMNGPLTLNPSIVFRAVESETENATWASSEAQKKEGEETSVTSGSGSRAGSEGSEDTHCKEQVQNIALSCEPMQLSPMIGLQPCPLIFYRDRSGDVETFRFLWSRMPYSLTPFKLIDDTVLGEIKRASYDDLRVAALSTIKFDEDPVPGGKVTNLWAFMSPRGKRVMFVLFQQDGDKTKSLHVRGDDKQLILCLVGTSSARRSLVSAIKPGLKPIHQEIFS